MPWWIRLTRSALPHWRGLVGMVCLTMVISALQVLSPWPVKLVIDSVLSSDPLPSGAAWIVLLPGGNSAGGLLLLLAGAVLVLFVISRIMDASMAVITNEVGLRMNLSVGRRIFERLQHQSLLKSQSHAVGDMVRRIDHDSGCVRDLIMGVYVPVLTAVAPLAAIIVIAVNIDPVLTFVAAVAAAPMPFVIRRFAVPMEMRMYEKQEVEGRLFAQAERALVAMPMIQAFGQESREHEQFSRLTDSSVAAHMRALASQLKFNAGVWMSMLLGTVVVMLVGGFRVLNGHVTVGDLYLFLMYLASLYAPMETFVYVGAGLAAAKASSRRVLEVLNEPLAIADPADPIELPPPAPRGSSIAFRQVRFEYNNGTPVLDGVSLLIESGQTVAIVGNSGIGKTTLISLILRFIDPAQGHVELDGVDIRKVRLHDVRGRIAYVPQDPTLLQATFAQNIAYGRLDASNEDIRNAARDAGIAQFIEMLPSGYEQSIGERSATLSGGQAQRLSIARALVMKPSVLILDEPTSSLDAQTEKDVMAAIRKTSYERTTIIIAHRLSTIRHADQIFVLGKGGVEQCGTHEDLMRVEGTYRQLYANQMDEGWLRTKGRGMRVVTGTLADDAG